MLQELDQPFLAERVEEPFDIGVQYPVHTLRLNPEREGIHCIMLPSARPESIRESPEVRLVNGIEHLHDCPLDDFVFQGSHAQRTNAAVGLRNVSSPDRLRFVAPVVQASMEGP